jgi:hypothetical protein
LETVLDLNTVGPSPAEMVPLPKPAATLVQVPSISVAFSWKTNLKRSIFRHLLVNDHRYFTYFAIRIASTVGGLVLHESVVVRSHKDYGSIDR